MTLKQLDVFIAVADTGSFSKGGELVSLTQSTVSQHIKALEEELGARLFERAASRALLTEAGRLFYDHATRIRTNCREASEAIRRFQGLEEATLRVGASTIPATCLIPDRLGAFRVHWPGVTLHLAQGDSQEVLRMLQDSKIELAIVGGKTSDDRLVYQHLLTDRIVLIFPPSFDVKSFTCISDLISCGLIMRESGSGTRQAVDSALVKAGVDPRALRVIAELGSSEAIRRAVLSGAGPGFISALAVSRDLEVGSLIEVPIPELEITRSIHLCWRKGITLSAAALTFISFLTSESLPTLDQPTAGYS